MDGRRYVVCYNAEQAKRDAIVRQESVSKLQEKLREGDKALVENKGFRKYLRSRGAGFEVDPEAIEAEARLDGKWVLRTNSSLSADQVALTYKQLWMVEAIFRTLKSTLDTRPIYHRLDETIRGHIFCSFLALVLSRELQDRMAQRGWGEAECADVLRDLDGLLETEVETSDGKRFFLRSNANGWCGKVFQAVGVCLSPTVRLLAQKASAPGVGEG
ncbi:MAG: transposase [Bradymonadales bacterium]|nr:transposase [Bradymonadales bacterium]